MTKKSQISETYDNLFKDGGYGGGFDLPYRHSCYYPLFKRILSGIVKQRAHKVLEVGCGTGAFAHMLLAKSTLEYRGFDFSKVAVEKAGARTGKPELFYVADATVAESYIGSYDTIVCTEVLEHV